MAMFPITVRPQVPFTPEQRRLLNRVEERQAVLGRKGKRLPPSAPLLDKGGALSKEAQKLLGDADFVELYGRDHRYLGTVTRSDVTAGTVPDKVGKAAYIDVYAADGTRLGALNP